MGERGGDRNLISVYQFAKLMGAENYVSWTYEIEKVLQVEDLWGTVKAPRGTADAPWTNYYRRKEGCQV